MLVIYRNMSTPYQNFPPLNILGQLALKNMFITPLIIVLGHWFSVAERNPISHKIDSAHLKLRIHKNTEITSRQ